VHDGVEVIGSFIGSPSALGEIEGVRRVDVFRLNTHVAIPVATCVLMEEPERMANLMDYITCRTVYPDVYWLSGLSGAAGVGGTSGWWSRLEGNIGVFSGPRQQADVAGQAGIPVFNGGADSFLVRQCGIDDVRNIPSRPPNLGTIENQALAK